MLKHRTVVSILTAVFAVALAISLLALLNHQVRRAYVTDGRLALSDADMKDGMVLLCDSNPESETDTTITHTFRLTINGEDSYSLYRSGGSSYSLIVDGLPASCLHLGNRAICPLDAGTHVIQYQSNGPDFLATSEGNLYAGTLDQATQMYQDSSLYDHFLIGSSLFIILFAISLFIWKRSEKYLLFFALHAGIALFLSTRPDISQFLNSLGLSFLDPLPALNLWLGAAGNYSFFTLNYALLPAAVHWMIYRVFVDDRIGGKSYIWWLLLSYAVSAVAIIILRYQTDVLMVSYLFYFFDYLAEGIVLLRNKPHLQSPTILTVLQMTWAFSLVFWLFRTASNYGYITFFPYNLGGMIAISYTVGFLLAINGKFSMKFAEADTLSQKLAAINETLEKRVEEKTQSLKESYAQMEAANKSRNEFMANMIHNLKTPLFSMSGYAEILRKEIQGADSQAQAHLELVCNNATYAQRMLKQLLLSNRLEEKSIVFHHLTFDLVGLLRRVVSTFLPTTRERQIALELQPHLPVILYDGDDFYLEQAVQNILDNAILQTGPGKEVLVECGASENVVWIRITDHGCGIPAEVLPHIMERCYSYHPDGEKSSGLGLTISQEIIKAHGGDIEVESQVGEGSSFTIHLPYDSRESGDGNHLAVDIENQIADIL